jgi:tetratricopeptide (TPR) repeat protein
MNSASTTVSIAARLVLLGLWAGAAPLHAQENSEGVDAPPAATAVAVEDPDDQVEEIDGTRADNEPVPPQDLGAQPAIDAGQAGAASMGPSAAANGEEELMAQFRRFQELMENGSIDEADAVAKRVVELAIRTSGRDSTDTAKALTNLAIVQQRTDQYDAAIQNYEGAIEIIEDQTDQLDAMLINPLKGLGAAQLANGRPDQALQTFGRAVHISHVNSGPHNIDQIELLESLAETNLVLGEVDEARDVHELIYNLNERHYRANMLDLIPSLERRAKWQHRTGYYNDERATYRRIIRILEEKNGKNDVSLIDPYVELGKSYYYVDTNPTDLYTQVNPYSAEIYFKKAVRIAENHEEATWVERAQTKLALADYYMQQQSVPSARKVYRDVWGLLSESEERLELRARALEQLNPLILTAIPEFAGDANRGDLVSTDVEVRQGNVAVSYSVSDRGRVSDLEVVEFAPDDFPEMLRNVQRQVRARLYRPRFRDGEPVDTEDQLFNHEFYYRVSELEERRAAQANNE